MTDLTTDNAVQDAPATQSDLASLAQQARWQVIKTVTGAKAGHIGGPLSMMDLLVTLYFEELRVDPSDARADDRERFVLFPVGTAGHVECHGVQRRIRRRLLAARRGAHGFPLAEGFAQPRIPGGAGGLGDVRAGRGAA